MKKAVCVMLFLGNLLFAGSSFANLPVFDFATWYQLVEEFDRLGDQLTQLEQQTTSLKQGLTQLGSYNWNTAQAKINELGTIVNKTDTLAYSASDIDSKFRTTYPGYQTTASTTYADQYKSTVNTTQNTLNSILQSMGSSATNFADENTRLQTLQSQAANADGQTKAIQAASQIASAEVEELQLLRQTMIAQTNAQTAYYAAETQKDASAKSAFDSLVNTSKQDVTGKLDQSPVDSPF